jgi:hypothetical protein
MAEHAAARVAELRDVLRSTHSPDVRDAVEAAIADVEQQYNLGSHLAAQRLQPQRSLTLKSPRRETPPTTTRQRRPIATFAETAGSPHERDQ